MNNRIIYIFLVIIITAAALLPSLFNNFVNFDDPHYVVDNELIKKCSLSYIEKIFTRGFVGCYCPLVMLSYMTEYHFFGLNPFIYHLTNYLSHIAICLALFYFIYLLSKDPLTAFITALLFGVHPLHVESVAWVTERKDVLSTLFYLFALISYVKYIKEGKRNYYLWCLVATLLSLLSKPMAVTLPFILLLLDYFYGRKLNTGTVVEKIPPFILAIAFGLVSYHLQVITGGTDLKATLGVKAYFLAKAIPFYLAKIFMPIRLCGMYLYHDIGSRHFTEIKWYIAVLLVLVVLIFLSRRYSKKVIFGSAFFIVTLLPVLKIIPAGDSFAADRYMYLPSIGIFYIIAVFFKKLLSHTSRILRVGATIALVCSIAALSVITWQRCGVWKDTESFFLDVIRQYPTRAVLYNDLGAFLSDRGDLDKAIRCFRVALMFDKGCAGAEGNLKTALAAKQFKEQYEEGEEVFRAKLERAASILEKVKLLNKFGIAQGQAKNIDKAIALFEEAIALDPTYADSYHNLGYAYYIKGDSRRAEDYFRKTLAIDPNHKNARLNLDFIEKNREYLK